MSSRIAAVVLAAGMSRRMGRPKALLPLGGLPMIVRVVEPILALDRVDSVVVVTGHSSEQVRGAMDGCAVEFVHNPNYEAGGMLSSVKAGCRAIADRCNAFFLVLGDQPLVQESTYRALLPRDTGLRPVRAIVQPTIHSRRGHPILLSSDCIEEILSLPHDATLKDFTRTIAAEEIAVDDPGILADIDTPDDYHLALEQFATDRSEPCQSKD